LGLTFVFQGSKVLLGAVVDGVKSEIVRVIEKSDKRLTPREVAFHLSKAMEISTKDVKRGMNELVFEGRLEFTYYGGQSYIELPLRVLQDDVLARPRNNGARKK